MRLTPNWQKIVKKAWSIRLMILAGLLSGAEIILPFYADEIPRGTFAALTMLAVTGAFIARLIAQQEFEHDAK